MLPSSSTARHEHDAPLLSVGKECAYHQCFVVDFLPLKCEHCDELFCQNHFRVAGHHCAKYDARKHNRVAPSCTLSSPWTQHISHVILSPGPLCSLPVSVRTGEDTDVCMDRHIEKECSYITGEVKARTSPICSRLPCKKVLFVPITCIVSFSRHNT